VFQCVFSVFSAEAVPSLAAAGASPILDDVRYRPWGFLATLIGVSALGAQEKPAQPLPPVTVAEKQPPTLEEAKYAPFFQRKKVGLGTFRTRAEFDSAGATDLVSALQGIPGVAISSTFNPYGQFELRFRMSRCPGQPPNIAIYVDGHRRAVFGRLTGNKGSELSTIFTPKAEEKSSCEECAKIGEALASIPLSSVQFIEFYRGPGQIPAELDRGDACAALVVWTR
jgi:hypothetical protein